MTVVIGTAGHIDHGKTSLLRALTGIDADRLPEERRRGMTIDVGYAHLRLADGDELDFVDVPGHDRLVGNMLVGAGEIDAALLVIAADDGPRAQTLEHLELLDGLGIDIGVVAITKVDVVDAARVEAVVAQARELLARTTLARSPTVPVSAIRGDGLAAMLAALTTVRDRIAGRWVDRPPRLTIDRVFTVRGRGLVVTGTLRGGPMSRGDSLRLEPGGRSVRAREVQVHGVPVAVVERGGRAALNLAGADEPEPRRGDTVTTDPLVVSTADLLVRLRRPVRLDDRAAPVRWPPAPGSTTRLHIGTAQVDATPGRGPRAAARLPDDTWVVRVRLGEPIATARGDRFVLRRSSPARSAAGGVVLDPAPPVGASRRRITPALLVRLGEAGPEALAPILLDLHGLRPADPGVASSAAGALGGWVLAADVEEALSATIVAAVAAAGASGLHLAELRADVVRRLRRLVMVTPKNAVPIATALVDRLVFAGRIERDGDLVRAPGTTTAGFAADLSMAMDRLEAALDVGAPPPLGAAAIAAGCGPDGIRALEAAGRLVRLEPDLAYAASAFARIEAEALRLAAAKPLLPSDLRDATGTSRKYVLAVLQELDRRGVLRRTPDGHVVGPRARR